MSLINPWYGKMSVRRKEHDNRLVLDNDISHHVLPKCYLDLHLRNLECFG